VTVIRRVRDVDITPKWRSFAASFLSGIVGLALIVLVCFRFGTGLAPVALPALCLVLLVALRGDFLASVVLTIIAVVSMDYFFVPPLFAFSIDSAERDWALALFLTASLFVITLTKKLQASAEALRRSNAYLAGSQRLGGAGTLAFNATSALFSSETNYSILGLDPLKGLPNWETVLQRIDPDDRERVDKEIKDALRQKREFAIEFRIVLPDGTLKQIESIGGPMFPAHGEPIDMVTTFLDVTERKRAQEEHERLRQLELDLAHVNRMSVMGEFAASLAHEILHPIATARNNARAGIRFLDIRPPDLMEVKQALTCIVTDADRAKIIVDRMRDHIKKVPPRRESLNLNEAIREVIVMVRSAIDKNGISVRTRLMSGLNSVRGDRVQLQQVILNLILNAMEAMSTVEEGARELEISTKQLATGELLVAVQDTGAGIDPENIERVFGLFYTTKTDGMGMGLSVCRSIIDAHGGRLWAEANPPRGATFQFTLPAAVDDS
jgi:signal transduction histidine kinase